MHLLHVGYTILYAHEPYIQTNTYIHTYFFIQFCSIYLTLLLSSGVTLRLTI